VKVVTIVGARPQFIKAAAVSRALAAHEGIEERLLHTGQHHDENMSSVFFAELGIPEPHANLGIAGGRHGAMTGAMLAGIEAYLVDEAPDWVLVYGDTNSTLAGALAAAKLHVPIAHVEAGLRSFNRRMPEEVNRVLTDHASTLLLAPTETAVANLEREGIDGARVHLVGDVMYDAALHVRREDQEDDAWLARHDLTNGGYVLATVHRAENTDAPERLRVIVDGLVTVSASIPVVLPLHPRTRGALDTAGLLPLVERHIRVLPPVGYLDMSRLERHASLIVTDSGGVQKEAYFHRVPCVTVRDETEWVELVDHGWNVLSPPTDAEALAAVIQDRRGVAGADVALYGDGMAAETVARLLRDSAVR